MTDQVGARWIEYVPLAALRPDPKNPKRHDIPTLRASMGRWGYTEPVQVDERTGLLVSGHGRRELLLDDAAAGREPPEGVAVGDGGAWLVPVVRGWASVDDDEAAGYLIAANAVGPAGGWDVDLLAELMGGLADSPLALEGVGMSTDELADLLAVRDELESEQHPAARLTDPDEVPEPPPTPISQRGDLWLCGPHRVLCGDSTVLADVERVMAGAKADMVWTDPPYGVSYADKNRFLNAVAPANRIQEPIVGDHLDVVALRVLLEAGFANGVAVCRPGAAWFVAAPGMGPPLRVFADVLDDLGVSRAMLVWVKDGFVLGRSDYHGRHEQLFYGWTPGAAHTPPLSRNQDSVWEVPRPRASQLHPTTKPVALIERAVVNHSQTGDTVLDLFAGSGSTLMACHSAGRLSCLIENDEHYTDVICRRWQRATGLLPVLEATGQTVDFDGAQETAASPGHI